MKLCELLTNKLAVDPKFRINYTGLKYFPARICENVFYKGRDAACYSNRSCHKIPYIYLSLTSSTSFST